MPHATKTFDWSGTVAMDYGQFQLLVRVGSEEFNYYTDNIDDMAVLNAAMDGVGIAQHGPAVVVLSPHQNNFKMAIAVETWDGPVADDLDDWEEAFEVWLNVDETGIHFDSPTLDGTAIPAPPGAYRALITGRGFVANGWPGSTTPGDNWRIRLVPDTETGQPSHLAAGTHQSNPLGPAASV